MELQHVLPSLNHIDQNTTHSQSVQLLLLIDNVILKILLTVSSNKNEYILLFFNSHAYCLLTALKLSKKEQKCLVQLKIYF